jgi:hypothetical protein
MRRGRVVQWLTEICEADPRVSNNSRFVSGTDGSALPYENWNFGELSNSSNPGYGYENCIRMESVSWALIIWTLLPQ